MDAQDFFPYANSDTPAFVRPKQMPQMTSQSLESLLIEYEQILNRVSPRTIKNLKQGLTAKEIATLEKEYEVKIPSELAKLYHWHNGEPEDYGDGMTRVFPLGQFVPLEDSLMRRELWLRRSETVPSSLSGAFNRLLGHQRSWVEVVTNASGTGHFVDLLSKAGEGNVIYYRDDPLTFICFTSISNYLAMLVEAGKRDWLVDSEFGLSFAEIDSLSEDEFEMLQLRFGADCSEPSDWGED